MHGNAKVGRTKPAAGGEAQVRPAPREAVLKAGAAAEPALDTLNIPEKELTPSVRNGLTVLMQEIERLRGELDHSRNRLEELARTADQDSLLPILNRRAFVREITRAIGVAERYGTPSSLLFFDLDNFKSVNDGHGHLAGDAVLRHFGEFIQSQIRDSDVFARIGGDEFGMILNHASLEQANRKAASLAKALRTSLPVWNGQTVFLSFSYGASEVRAGQTAEAAIEQADQAMYAQKMRRHASVRP